MIPREPTGLEFTLYATDLFTEDARVSTDGDEIGDPPKVFLGVSEAAPRNPAIFVTNPAGIFGVFFEDDGSPWSISSKRDPNLPGSSFTIDIRPSTRDVWRDASIDLRGDSIDLNRSVAVESEDLGLSRLASHQAGDDPETGTQKATPQKKAGPHLQSGAIRAFTIQAVANSGYLQEAGGTVSAATALIATQLGYTRWWLQQSTNLSLKVRGIQVFAASSDPFLQPGTLLDLLRAYRVSDPVTPKAGAYFLFFNGTGTLNCGPGCAYRASLCTSNALGYSTAMASWPIMAGSMMTAHEIGHILNAIHVDDPLCGNERVPPSICIGGSRGGEECATFLDCCVTIGECTAEELSGSLNCLQNPYDPIMSPTLPIYLDQAEKEYDDCNVPRITNHIASSPVSCDYPITCADVNSGGSVTSSDAQEALSLSVCSSCPYNALADIVLPFSTSGGVTAADALGILQVAVGLAAVPSTCGAD